MAATNLKTKKTHIYADERLAGGHGPHAANQNAEKQLRRAVMACLLWENVAYQSGETVAQNIQSLVPQVAPEIVASIAVEARELQKLRHVPLLICREMARLPQHKAYVADTLAKVIRRPDEMAEFLSLYWGPNRANNNNKKTLSAQVKRGLARVFAKFDEYQLAKYDRDSKEVKLRDVLFLCHAKPSQDRQDLHKRLIDGQLQTPDTWEVGLSAAKTDIEKCAVWTRLLESGKLGALAFLKNLRNMEQVSVPRAAIAGAFEAIRPSMLLPIDFIRADRAAPKWRREIETLMFKCAAEFPKLTGWTTFVMDVSGSMQANLSSKTEFNRLDVGASMAMLAAEMCEHISVYATAGSDHTRTHQTQMVPSNRGFALCDAITGMMPKLGGGGIFTRQCLEFIQRDSKELPDRVVVFSDSQDMDRDRSQKPKPFGRYNYIIDVSSHSHGINYDGVWTAEIAGWSENFLRYMHALENSQ